MNKKYLPESPFSSTEFTVITSPWSEVKEKIKKSRSVKEIEDLLHNTLKDFFGSYERLVQLTITQNGLRADNRATEFEDKIIDVVMLYLSITSDKKTPALTKIAEKANWVLINFFLQKESVCHYSERELLGNDEWARIGVRSPKLIGALVEYITTSDGLPRIIYKSDVRSRQKMRETQLSFVQNLIRFLATPILWNTYGFDKKEVRGWRKELILTLLKEESLPEVTDMNLEQWLEMRDDVHAVESEIQAKRPMSNDDSDKKLSAAVSENVYGAKWTLLIKKAYLDE